MTPATPTDTHSVLELLRQALTDIKGTDEESQTRALLLPLLARKAKSQPPVPADSSTCPNCSKASEDPRTPYCSDHCKEMAAFVRQFRAAVAEGTILEPEKQMMMGQKLWAVAIGGYPMRQTLVPAKVIAKVIEREGGKCQMCGAPATEIDHTGSG